MTRAELEAACEANDLRVEFSDFDCGTRVTVYAAKRRVITVSRECADDESPVDIVVRYLTTNHYLPFDAAPNAR